MWPPHVVGSGFAGQADFAKGRRGHLGLQDHGNEAYLRNVRIRALDQGCSQVLMWERRKSR